MYQPQKPLNWAKLRVGVVVTSGLAILFLVVLFSGSIRRFFTPQARISVSFADVKGLRPGAPVWFSGVQVGSVRSLRFDTGERIAAVLDIDRSSLAYLKMDSEATIQTMGLLGDKYIELGPGSRAAAALKPGDSIAGVSPPEIAEELKRLVGGMEGGAGSLTRFLRDDTLYRDLAAAARDVKAFAASLRNSEGTVAKAVRDPALYNRFQKAAASLDAFTAGLVSSRGTLKRLVEDASLYENMNRAAERMNAILERVENGQGSLGALIKDREVVEELQTTLKEFSALVKDMKENPKRYFSVSVF